MPTCIIRALEKKEELLLGSVSEVQPTDTPAKTCEPGSATSTVAFKDRSLIDQRMAEWLRKAAEPPGGEVDPGGAAHVGPGPGVASQIRAGYALQADFTGITKRKTCTQTQICRGFAKCDLR